MGQTAQQLQLRPAALETAPPKPGVIRGQKRHTPFADTVKQQKRSIPRARHDHIARGLNHLDLAHPAAPTADLFALTL